MSWPNLESNPIGKNTTNGKTSPIDSITIRKKLQNPRHEYDQHNRQHNQWSRQHNQRILQSERGKRTYQWTWSQTHHLQTCHQANLICRMIAIKSNPKEKNAIQGKIIRNTRNGNRQTHCRTILIRPTKVTMEERYAKKRSTKKASYQIMCKVNDKVSDNSM